MTLEEAERELRRVVRNLDLKVGEDALPTVLAELDKVREHRRSFGDIVVFTTEHVAAICTELDLSYEAETETVIAAIRRLRDGA